MIVERLTLTNWMPYRGKQEILLEPKVYGVSARDVNDAERSNWKGKTALVEAIRFALFGEHRFAREDDWITRGAEEGAVQAFFSGGLEFVQRARRRGGRTVLKTSSDAKGDHAQAEIERALCMTKADYEATCWVGQRETARLVLTEPAKRMTTIEGWLKLQPLRQAEDWNAGELEKLEAFVLGWREEIALGEATKEQMLQGSTLDQVEARLLQANEALEDLEVEHKELNVQLSKLQNVERLRDRLVRFRQLEAEAKEQRQRADGGDVDVLAHDLEIKSEARANADAKVNVLANEADAARKVARGEFSGKCPVAGIECPVTVQINAAGRSNRERYDEVVSKLTETRRRQQQAELAEREAIKFLSELRQEHQRAKDLEARVERERKELEASRVEPIDEAAVRARLTEVERERSELGRLIGSLDVVARQVSQIDKSIEARRESIIEQEPKLAALRAASLILGRAGARRRIAQPFLEQLEALANDSLAECGADLRVKVLWERESAKDLARACDQCGAPFPESARVKECVRCGAARGKHFVECLDFEFSDRSVAAEDLVGVTTQLAAAAWLREARGSPVSFVVLDEPMAHCDRANRRSMTRAFTHMLSQRFGFEQAFVISHWNDKDVYPGQILITGDGPYSTVEVTA